MAQQLTTENILTEKMKGMLKNWELPPKEYNKQKIIKKIKKTMKEIDSTETFTPETKLKFLQKNHYPGITRLLLQKKLAERTQK